MSLLPRLRGRKACIGEVATQLRQPGEHITLVEAVTDEPTADYGARAPEPSITVHVDASISVCEARIDDVEDLPVAAARRHAEVRNRPSLMPCVAEEVVVRLELEWLGEIDEQPDSGVSQAVEPLVADTWVRVARILAGEETLGQHPVGPVDGCGRSHALTIAAHAERQGHP